MGDAPTKSRRRWFQFSLRTLLVLVTLTVLLLVAWRIYVEPYRGQKETAEVIKKLGGSYTAEPGPKWMFSLLGEDANNLVSINLADCDTPDEYIRNIDHLPQLETLTVGGPHFTDEHLGRLHWLPALRNLVLDSTAVTDAGVAKLQQALPEVMIHRSQRRVLTAVRGLEQSLILQVNLVVRSVDRPRQTGMRLGDEHTEIATELILTEAWPPRRPSRPLGEELIHISRLNTLERLYINRPLTGEGLAHLQELTELRRLELIDTGLDDEGLGHLSLNWLEHLDLTNARVGDTGLVHLREWTNLRYLDLSGTRVSNRGLGSLEDMAQLETLILHATKVGDAGLVHLKSLRSLRKLYLHRTDVTDAGLPHLGALPKLQALDLGYTKVRDAGLAHLKPLDQLEWLYLKGTSISDGGLSHLHSMSRLEHLWLGNTLVTSGTAVARLEERLPNCAISH